MGLSRDVTRLAAIAAQLQDHPTEASTVEAVVCGAVAVVPDAEHVSLTVRRRHARYETAGATSSLATTADLLQYDLEEGPCVEAYAAAEALRSPDVTDDPRWTSWGPAAAQAGVRSVLSIGMLARGERVGSLNLYATTRDRFAEGDVVDLARTYATHAAYALHSARRRAGLELAISSRHLIGVAQGMLVERFGLDLDSSFALLQRLSSTHNRKLRDLCEELVRTGDTEGLLPGPD